MISSPFTHLFIEAVDVWLFRDGRPFDASSYHRAESMFPPYPTVIQGALRTYELLRRDVNLNDPQAVQSAVGTADDMQELKLRGPFVAKRVNGLLTRYFPQPADAFSVNGPKSPDRSYIRPASPPAALPAGVQTNLPAESLNPIGFDDPLTKGESRLWVAEEELIKYLRGETAEAVKAETLFMTEPHIGIGIESSRKTTRDGALYEVEFIRPLTGVGLSVEMQGYSGWPINGTLALGGESRMGFYSVQPALTPLLNSGHKITGTFKVYFATPACFELGWQPKNWNQFFEGQVKLISAALTGFDSVGGFDYALRQHKPARRYVPAGSVYYFETDQEVSIKPSVLENGMTDEGIGMGFGQIILEEYHV